MLTRILHLSPASRGAKRYDIETDEEHNYRHLLINGAWFGLIDGGILTYLPVFLARLGSSATMIGLLTSGLNLAGIVSYIPGGAYAERQTNLVKTAVRFGIIARLSFPLIALLPFFLPNAYIPLAAVTLWTVFFIANSVYMPAWAFVMQQAVSPRRRAEVNGKRWGTYSLVAAIALLVCGPALDRIPFPAGYQIVFVISFVAVLISLFYFSKVRVPPFRREATAMPKAGVRGGLRDFFRPLTESREFVRYNLAVLPFRLAQSIPVALFSIYWVDNLHASDSWIGWRGTVAYAALVVGYHIWGKTANRLGHRNLLFIAGALFALYPILTALAPSAPWLLPASIIWGLTLSGTDIGTFDMLLGCCPDGRQPSFIATANLLICLVSFLGPFIGAELVHILDVRSALLVSGAVQLVTAGFFILLPSREQEGLGDC